MFMSKTFKYRTALGESQVATSNMYLFILY